MVIGHLYGLVLSYLETGKFADFTLNTQDSIEGVRISRQIVASKSRYFEALFEACTTDQSPPIPIKFNTVKLLIRCIYGDPILNIFNELSSDEKLDLVHGSIYLDIIDVSKVLYYQVLNIKITTPHTLAGVTKYLNACNLFQDKSFIDSAYYSVAYGIITKYIPTNCISDLDKDNMINSHIDCKHFKQLIILLHCFNYTINDIILKFHSINESSPINVSFIRDYLWSSISIHKSPQGELYYLSFYEEFIEKFINDFKIPPF